MLFTVRYLLFVNRQLKAINSTKLLIFRIQKVIVRSNFGKLVIYVQISVVVQTHVSFQFSKFLSSHCVMYNGGIGNPHLATNTCIHDEVCHILKIARSRQKPSFLSLSKTRAYCFAWRKSGFIVTTSLSFCRQKIAEKLDRLSAKMISILSSSLCSLSRGKEKLGTASLQAKLIF